jgi:hypothetical protein
MSIGVSDQSNTDFIRRHQSPAQPAEKYNGKLRAACQLQSSNFAALNSSVRHKSFNLQMIDFQFLHRFPKRCNHISFLFGKAMFAVEKPPKKL